MLSGSSRVFLVFIAIAIIECMVARPYAQTSPLPLVVQRTFATSNPGIPGGGNTVVNVEVFNSGTKSITAWGLWVDLRLQSGETRRVPHFTDVLPATEPAKFTIPASGRAAVSVQCPGIDPGTIVSTTVSVSAVIFDDATAVGDDSSLSWMFGRRSEHLRAWNAISNILTAAKAQHSDPAAVLEEVKADLDTGDPQLRSSVEYLQARRRVMEGAGITPSRPASVVLDDLVSFVTARRDNQEAHSKRRPNQR